MATTGMATVKTTVILLLVKNNVPNLNQNVTEDRANMVTQTLTNVFYR